MATYMSPITHSPQTSDKATQPVLSHGPSPCTPVHSPHHSVNSSVSSRTPIHTLTIHEYRKQQHVPSLRIDTPSGKTLRRKAAAPTLNTAKPRSSVQTVRPQSQSTSRPLLLSHSAHQLNVSYQSPFQHQVLANQLGRAQSAEPRTQGGSISSISTTTSSGKVGHFKSRKRLPKPHTVTNLAPLSSQLAPTTSIPQHPRSPTALVAPVHRPHSVETPTTNTTSTFSLSRFPQPPPHLPDPSFSPPYQNNEHTRINALSHVSTAPATPPATPATIHYCGASFDLVNPHDSLLLHDIVTPSKDFGSSEYFLVPSEEEPYLNIADMAPKRALYGDFTAAHAGIMRRAEDSFSSSNLDLPLPPTPAAVSPGSSAYTSPIYSPESNFAPLPLAVAKAPNESRFSLRQLTRTLTKRLGRSPEKQQMGRELQDFRQSTSSLAYQGVQDDCPQQLQGTHLATPQSAYFPLDPTSPATPTGADEPLGHEDVEAELPRRHTFQRHDSEPLASLFPDDDYSTQAGRVDDPRTSMSDGYLVSKPYYDDIESIYASSSIYTSDDRRGSNYQQSLGGTRQSNPFTRYSGIHAGNFGIGSGDNQESLYEYSTRSNRKSKPLSQDMYRRMAIQEKTDTISKIIDQYDPSMSANTLSMGSEATTAEQGLLTSEPYPLDELTASDQPQRSKPTSGLGQFTFDVHEDESVEQARGISDRFFQQPAFSRDAGLPPRVQAPLAPPFQLGDVTYRIPHPDSSAMFSNQSYNSYGDTRNLLGISQPDGLGLSASNQLLPTSSSYSQPPMKSLEPSSSYSQPTHSTGPPTPQEALDQADQIFQNASGEQKSVEKGIPAMWIRRSSGSLLLAKQNSVQPLENRQSSGSTAAGLRALGESNEADWESVAGNSQGFRDSCGSAVEYGGIADYSSSEGTRNSLGVNSDGSLPSWSGQDHSRGASIYSHPSPIRAHHNPFSSSPPQLRAQGRLDPSSPPLGSSPPAVTTLSVFRFSTHSEDVESLEAAGQPYTHVPWANAYAFSDKETLELLASGPNDKIMIEAERREAYGNEHNPTRDEERGIMALTSSPMSVLDGPNTLERENTFEKLCVIGPKGNLTGTPRGTGMHETGSSVADTSSPGQMTPGSARQYPGFYASPFLATGSVTTIQQSPRPIEPDHELTPSQITLFPRSTDLDSVTETSPDPGSRRRESVRSSTRLQKEHRRGSRPNVPGQTKLRQMVLAPDAARKTLSSADTKFSQYTGSERPSTSDTTTPLSPRPPVSVGTLPIVRTLIAHQHSPHLLSVEKDLGREDEERRRKLSWIILAVFCVLPPCMFLYRVYGDRIMISLTKGDVGTCTSKAKRVAFIGGIAVNTGLITAIVIPIVVLHALGAAS